MDMIARLLGKPIIESSNHKLPRGKPEQLLVELALANGPLAVDDLLDGLWPDNHGAAKHTLQVHAATLRKALGAHAPLLVCERGSYELRIPRHRLDASAYTDLVAAASELLLDGDADSALVMLDEAAALDRGDPATGLPETSAIARARLIHRRGRTTLILMRGEALIETGRFDEAADELAAAPELDSGNEAVSELAIRSSYLAGRYSDATSFYREAVRRTGGNPSQRLRRLDAAMRHDERGLVRAMNRQRRTSTQPEAIDIAETVSIATARLHHSDPSDSIRELEIHLPAIRAVIQRWVEGRLDEQLSSLLVSLRWFALFGGYLTDGLRWLTIALSLEATPPAKRLAAHYAAGCIASAASQTTVAEDHLKHALDIADQADDRVYIAWITRQHGERLLRDGAIAAAIDSAETALRIFAAADDVCGQVHAHALRARGYARAGDSRAATSAANHSVRAAEGSPYRRDQGHAELAAAAAEHASQHHRRACKRALRAAWELHDFDRPTCVDALRLVAATTTPDLRSWLGGAIAALDQEHGAIGHKPVVSPPAPWLEGWNQALANSHVHRTPGLSQLLEELQKRLTIGARVA